MKLRELKRWDKFKLLGHEHTTYKFDTYDCIDSALKTDVYFCYNMLDGRRCRFSGDLDVILPPFNIKQ